MPMQPTVVFQGHTTDPQTFFARYQRSAAALLALGVGPGDVVALLLRNQPAMLELMLATRWIGAHWCPINWHFKADELHYVLADSGAKVLVADGALLGPLRDACPAAVHAFVLAPPEEAPKAPDPAAGYPLWEHYRDGTHRPAPPESAPRGAMLYTSGTTGRPKGIRRQAATPEQAARSLEVQRLTQGYEPGMRSLVSAPMYHSAPNSFSVVTAQGDGHLVIEPRFDALQTLQMIERHRITHAYLVPTMYVRLLRLPEVIGGVIGDGGGKGGPTGTQGGGGDGSTGTQIGGLLGGIFGGIGNDPTNPAAAPPAADPVQTAPTAPPAPARA